MRGRRYMRKTGRYNKRKFPAKRKRTFRKRSWKKKGGFTSKVRKAMLNISEWKRKDLFVDWSSTGDTLYDRQTVEFPLNVTRGEAKNEMVGNSVRVFKIIFRGTIKTETYTGDLSTTGTDMNRQYAARIRVTRFTTEPETPEPTIYLPYQRITREGLAVKYDKNILIGNPSQFIMRTQKFLNMSWYFNQDFQYDGDATHWKKPWHFIINFYGDPVPALPATRPLNTLRFAGTFRMYYKDY